MPQTYTPIASTTVGTATNSVTFSSIPSTYTDLILVVNGVLTGSGGGRFRVNGDTGTNYSYTRVYGNGSAAASDRNSNQDFAYGSNLTTVVSNGIYHFMNYSNTTTNKTIISRNSASDAMVNAVANLWRSTAAINSITFDTGGYNMTTGFALALYGIKAA